jgi:enhancer of polycomb-like protein
VEALEKNAANTQVIIPTPDASKVFDDYETLYLPTFHLPHSKIRFSAFIEDEIGCDYNCSDDDLNWIQEQKTDFPDLHPDEFEKLLSLLEVIGDEDKVPLSLIIDDSACRSDFRGCLKFCY